MPTCFVAKGFGIKMAFYGGKKKPRALGLDKTYQNVIKPVAIAAGSTACAPTKSSTQR